MPVDQKFTHGPEFQRQVIKFMLSDERFCAKCAELLQEAFFAGELKWFFSKITSLYKTFGGVPSGSIIESEINLHGLDAQKYIDEFQLIQKAANSGQDQEYVKRELTGFIRNNIFVDTYKQASVMYNAGSRENAYVFTQSKMEELQKVDFLKERETSFGDHEAVMDAAVQQMQNAIPTGFFHIDESMGGLLPQTWTTILSGSNAGKSMLSPNFARQAAMVGKKTFVTIHEDEEIPTKIRFLACFSGVPIAKFYIPKLMWTKEEKEAVEVADQVLSQYVKLRFLYATESTIETVQEVARRVYKEWKFDLFICDYGQCLTTSKFKSLDNTRLVQEYIYHELKQLCLELNVAGVGGAQVNRMGHAMNKTGADLLRCTDVGESWGIVKKSSNVITLNRSESDATANRAVFLLDKARNGRCPIVVDCVTDYSRARTHWIERETVTVGGVTVQGNLKTQKQLDIKLNPIDPGQPPQEYLDALRREAAEKNAVQQEVQAIVNTEPQAAAGG